MRLLPKPLRDNWRWHLDTRDPDYLEPPSQEEIDEAGEAAIDVMIEDRFEEMTIQSICS